MKDFFGGMIAGFVFGLIAMVWMHAQVEAMSIRACAAKYEAHTCTMILQPVYKEKTDNEEHMDIE